MGINTVGDIVLINVIDNRDIPGFVTIKPVIDVFEHRLNKPGTGGLTLQFLVIVRGILRHGEAVGFALVITKIGKCGAENEGFAASPTDKKRTEACCRLISGRPVIPLSPTKNRTVDNKQRAVVGNKGATLLRQPKGFVPDNQ